MEEELRGKVALVTGLSQGIGRCIALELARAGSDVVLTGRGEDKLKTVAAEIEALGRKTTIDAADLTADAEPADLVAALEHSFGRLDILVCSAGAARRGNFFTLSDQPDLAAPDRRLDRAPVADYMIGATAIGASVAFMRALAEIGKKDGVQVNTVNPGSVDTDRFRRRLAIIMARTELDEAKAIEHHRKELDITRFGTPQDVAGLVRFIVSPRGSWIHGSAIDIDGGQVGPLRMTVND